jgi:hypothetical protein
MLIQLLHHPDQLVLAVFSVGLTSFVFLAARVAFFELEGTAFVTITGFVTLQLSKVSSV